MNTRRIQPRRQMRAFTLFEGMVVAAVGLLLLAVAMPMLARPRHRRQANCVNHLRQIGIAVRIWEGDNDDKYPTAVAVTNGGAMELIATGNVAGCFQVMSNELGTATILVCPQDRSRDYATNFETLKAANLSYFFSLDARESDPQAILSGDANLLLNGAPVCPGVFNLATNTVAWAPDRHEGAGNLLTCDGSAHVYRVSPAQTNRVAVP